MLNFRERLGLLSDVSNAVETRVATNGDVIQAMLMEQSCRGFVLHEEVGYRLQLFAEPFAVGLEEKIVLMENERNVKQRNARLFQSPHIIEPKIVFDEKCRHEMMAFHPTSSVTRCVDRKVGHLVGIGIIFPDLIARR